MEIREFTLHAYLFNRYLDIEDARVKILNKGKYDGFNPGPDFRVAVIEVATESRKEQRKGDIEIHVYASDWYKHGHHKDPEYKNVVLHVVLYDDKKGPDIPTVEISRNDLTYFVEELGKRALHEKPICLPSQKTTRAFQKLLEVNGSIFLAERFEVTFELIMNNPDWEADLSQAIYERILYVLGLDHNPSQMMAIGREIDLKTAESIIDAEGPIELYHQYVNTAAYKRTKDIGQPMNYPKRRLEGMAFLLEKALQENRSLFRVLCDIRRNFGLAGLISFFTIKDSRGEEFLVKARGRRMAQIGEEKATQLLLQGMTYFDFFHISKNDLLSFKPQSKFQINCERIFGERVIENIYQNQGMIDVVNNYCTAKPAGCWNCPIQFYCREFWLTEKVSCVSCDKTYYDSTFNYCPSCGAELETKK
jgi:Protein of unknown function (DUF2851)